MTKVFCGPMLELCTFANNEVRFPSAYNSVRHLRTVIARRRVGYVACCKGNLAFCHPLSNLRIKNQIRSELKFNVDWTFLAHHGTTCEGLAVVTHTTRLLNSSGVIANVYFEVCTYIYSSTHFVFFLPDGPGCHSIYGVYLCICMSVTGKGHKHGQQHDDFSTKQFETWHGVPRPQYQPATPVRFVRGGSRLDLL